MTDRVITSWRKNARETVLVRITRFNGADLLDMRVCFQREGHGLSPSKKGLTLRLDQIKLLRDALRDAERAARDADLL